MVRLPKISDFKKNNPWVTIGIVIAVLAVLLLPELLRDKSKSFTSSLQQKLEGDEPVRKKKQKSRPQTSEEDTGPSTSIAKQAQEQLNSFLGERVSPSGSKKIRDFVLQYGGRGNSSIELVGSEEPLITWEYLRSRKVKTSTEKAKSRIKLFITKLGDSNLQASRLLEDFVSSLDAYSEAEELGFEAEGVVRAIEDQEYQITNQFRSMKVPRLLMVDWALVSLSRLYGSDQMVEYKIDSVPGFYPDFFISFVKIYLDKRKAVGKQTLLLDYKLDLRAIINSSDVIKIKLIHIGRKEQPIQLGNNVPGKNYREIQLTNLEAAGVYKFIFEDPFGFTYSKSYSFDPRYRRIAWTGQDNVYYFSELPSQTGAGTDFIDIRQDFSSKVDSYFKFKRDSASGFQDFGSGFKAPGFKSW